MRRSVTIENSLHEHIIELKGWFGMEKHWDVDYTTVLNMLAKLGADVFANSDLTDRQKHLLHYLASDSNTHTTVTSHAILSSISRQTAAKDIKELEKVGLVLGEREGKYIKYRATKKLLEALSGN